MDPPLEGADGLTQKLSGFFVGASLNGGELQHTALIFREPGEGTLKGESVDELGRGIRLGGSVVFQELGGVPGALSVPEASSCDSQKIGQGGGSGEKPLLLMVGRQKGLLSHIFCFCRIACLSRKVGDKAGAERGEALLKRIHGVLRKHNCLTLD